MTAAENQELKQEKEFIASTLYIDEGGSRTEGLWNADTHVFIWFEPDITYINLNRIFMKFKS